MTEEINDATGGLISIVDKKQEIISVLDNARIDYRVQSSITVNGKSISTAIKVPNPKAAILSKPSEDKKTTLQTKGWEVFDIETMTINDRNYEHLLTYLGI